MQKTLSQYRHCRLVCCLAIWIIACQYAWGQNKAPALTTPPDQIVSAGYWTNALCLLSDDNVCGVKIVAVSSDKSIVADSNIVITGYGSKVYIYAWTTKGKTGGTTITVTADNGLAKTAINYRITTQTPTSARAQDHEFRILAYPNPASGLATIAGELDVVAPLTVELTNLLGETVLRLDYGTLSGYFSRTFDASSLPQGAYLLSVRNGGAVKTLPLLIAR